MHRLRLALNTSTTFYSLWTLARPVVLVHLVPRMHLSASATNVARRVARRLPHSHAAALLKPPPRFTIFAPLAMTFSSTCLLALLKRKIQKQQRQRKHPPSHSLALWGRRCVLASLSVPALVSTSVPPCPDTTNRTRRRTVKPKFWRVITTPSSIVSRLLFNNAYIVQHSSALARFLYKMNLSQIFANSPVHPRIPEP